MSASALKVDRFRYPELSIPSLGAPSALTFKTKMRLPPKPQLTTSLMILC